MEELNGKLRAITLPEEPGISTVPLDKMQGITFDSLSYSKVCALGQTI